MALADVKLLELLWFTVNDNRFVIWGSALTTEDIHAPLAFQLSYFLEGAEKPKPSRVDGLHGPKYHMRRWLAATQLRRILNVI
jgi:hypothetical protein